MRPASSLIAHLGLVALCWISPWDNVRGQVATILHPFGNGTALPQGTPANQDGTSPATALIQGRDGNFYGTTSSGGTNGTGTAFAITPQGGVTILHNFGDATVTNDGLHPNAALIQGSGNDTNFYGTTSSGGANGAGTAFAMTPRGGVTILHSFGDNTVLDTRGNPATDGVSPAAALIQSRDGNFYGTTTSGGTNTTGTAFVMTPGGIVTILHNFGDGTVSNDGLNPSAGLIQGKGSDTNFYGTAPGGGTNGKGTVFAMTPLGIVTILHHFGGSAVDVNGSAATDGTFPASGLIQDSGNNTNFYGTTLNGGAAHKGTAFAMTPLGAVTILHGFGGATDGTFPVAGLTQGNDGNFYGTTSGGGFAGNGVAFEVTPRGGETILHSFGDGTALNPDGSTATDGTTPTAGLIQGSDGNFYGVTTGGGAGSNLNSSGPVGATFKLTIDISSSPQTFSEWADSYKITVDAAATPQNDGIPNLLKYLCDINPTTSTSATERAALPSLSTTSVGGFVYLTLTYRQNLAETGITIHVQTSPDLQTWTTLNPPDLCRQVSTDSTTGDPIMEVGVKITGADQFIRLNATSP